MLLPIPMPFLVPTPVFDNAAGTLAAHPAGYAVLRFAPGAWGAAALAELLAQTEALLVRHAWCSVLADARQLAVFGSEVFDWLLHHWLTRPVQQPPRLFKAVLLPTCSRAGAAIGLLREQAPTHTRYVYFASEAAAHDYLLMLAA